MSKTELPEGGIMKWLFRPVFHSDGLITFEKWKYVRESETQVLVVHKSVEDFRAFWKGV